MTTKNVNEIAADLANKVWFTRKAWIYAEKRLLANEHHTQLLMVAYSAYTTCLAVVLLVFEPMQTDKKLVDTSLAVLSIVLLALSLYLNSKSFKDRATRFKVGYHDLQHIENQLNSLSAQSNNNITSDEFEELANSYNKTLRDVENHEELDDIRSRINAGSGLISRHPTKTEFLRYFWWRCWRAFSLAFFYFAPVLAVIWFVEK